MKDTTKGYIAQSFSTLIMGFSLMFSKVTLGHGNPIFILAHRFSIAFLFILPIAILNRKKLSFTRETFFNLLPAGILYPVLMFTFQTMGLQHASSSIAGIIQSFTPIFTLIISLLFLKEAISTPSKIFTLVSVLGVLVIVSSQGVQGGDSYLFGILLVTLSVLSNSLYNVLVRKKTQSFSPLQITFISTFVGFIAFNTLALFQHFSGTVTQPFFAPFQNTSYVLGILYLGILSSLGTSILSNFALSKIPASKVSVFGNLGTVITILAGVFILKEPMTLIQVIGALIILIGVIGTNKY